MSTAQLELESVARSGAPAHIRAEALNHLAERMTGTDPQQALAYVQEAMALAEPLADRSLYLSARLNRAWINHELADYAASAREAAEVHKIAQRDDLAEQQYDALNILGNNHHMVGNRPDALDAFMQALAIAKTLGAPVKVATVENNIGLVYEGMKDFQKSLEYYQKALATYNTAQANPIMRSTSGANVAESCNALGRYAEALVYAQAAYQAASEREHTVGQAMAQLQCALAYQGLGQPEPATACYQLALEAIRRAESPYHEAIILKHLATEAIQQGQVQAGIEQLQRALSLVEPIQAYPTIFPLHELLAQAYEQIGNNGQALHHLWQYQHIKERVFNEQADSREKTLHALFEVDRARLEVENQRGRNEALQQQIAQNEAMIAELDSYAENVAHDLKNPIGIVLGFSMLLEMELDTLLTDTQRSNLQIITETAEKMQTIVESLLSLAQARKAEIMPQPIDMNQVVQAALYRLETALTARGVILEAIPDLPPAMGNPTWVEAAWVNYISNAIKYGGEPPRIRIDWTPEADGRIRYCVHDNGQGIQAAHLEKLFTRFERLGQLKIDGTGIGLTLVKTIIEKLGGEVRAESAGISGQGSTFSFTLPPVA
jgi:signal transduction histidine kinase